MPSGDNLFKHGYARSGKRKSKVYRCYHHMLRRCLDPKNPAFAAYGGRGILVCPRWRESFMNFIADMGDCPGPQYSLGRIDNNGNYEPGNVAWQTIEEQKYNTRRNVFLTARGKTMTLKQWADEVGIDRTTIRRRMRLGWPDEKAIFAKIWSWRKDHELITPSTSNDDR